MLERVPVRHLAIHFGAALAVVSIACAIPVFAVGFLGARWPVLLLFPLGGLACFIVGFVCKIARWMRAPVPFRIPLTIGQQRSLSSVKQSRFGNPHSAWEAIVRVLLDVVLFRPLWRATPTAPALGPDLGSSVRWLWLFAAAFHGSLAIVLLRHLRMFLVPVPRPIALLEHFDVTSDTSLPRLHVTTVIFTVAITCLLGRRLLLSRLRYISLVADYLPLLLLVGIAMTGFGMRHITGTDVHAVKQLVMSLASAKPAWPDRMDPLLLCHLFLVGTLLFYFPLSKLMHVSGAFMSPTLTLASANRETRHVNVCNPKVELRHYEDYEKEFRDRMVEAGLPVERE